MKEILFQSYEAEEFQEKPHIALVEYDPGKWNISLCWREDSELARIDAQYNFAQGLPIHRALVRAATLGKILNVPVARYEDDKISVLFQQERVTFIQKKALEIFTQSEKVKKFNTH